MKKETNSKFTSRRPTGLTVIESPYNYNAWKADCSGGSPKYLSELKNYVKPRVVDHYHEAGIYETGGLPVTVRETRYEDIASEYTEPCLAVTRAFSDYTYEAVKGGNLALATGGFCNFTPAIAGGIRRALGPDCRIGLIWMDAHADCSIAEQCLETGEMRLVAFPTAIMLGRTLPDFRRDVCGLDEPISGGNMIAGNLRYMSDPEGAIFSAEHVHWMDRSAFADAEKWDGEVKALASRVDVIYLALDADVLDAKYVPSYFRPEHLGSELDAVIHNVRSVMETGKCSAFSMFCFDFDKYDEGGETTAETGSRILRAALESWKECPSLG